MPHHNASGAIVPIIASPAEETTGGPTRAALSFLPPALWPVSRARCGRSPDRATRPDRRSPVPPPLAATPSDRRSPAPILHCPVTSRCGRSPDRATRPDRRSPVPPPPAATPSDRRSPLPIPHCPVTTGSGHWSPTAPDGCARWSSTPPRCGRSPLRAVAGLPTVPHDPTAGLPSLLHPLPHEATAGLPSLLRPRHTSRPKASGPHPPPPGYHAIGAIVTSHGSWPSLTYQAAEEKRQ